NIIDGGMGFDTVDGSGATAGLILATNGRLGTAVNSLGNVERIIGSSYADTLYCTAGDVLVGGGGDDTLISGGGATLVGGTGNDIYQVSSPTDTIVEDAGEGIDTVVAHGTYALAANVENLTFFELTADPYAGAAVPAHVVEDWNGTGTELANVLTGNAGKNIL